jgi:small multidrug resistance family-3 protein
MSLVIFAVLLTRIESIFAGRIFAAYGGVYIADSVLLLWLIEGQRPDKWDILGASICIVRAAIILFGQRQQI